MAINDGANANEATAITIAHNLVVNSINSDDFL
jgi:hypothetical protein